MKVTARYLRVTYRGVVPESVSETGVTEERVFITERTRLKYQKLKNELLKYVPFNDVVLVRRERVEETIDIPVQVVLEYGKLE